MADELGGDSAEEAQPGGGDVEDRPNEVGKFAIGSKGGEGIAERLEVTLELLAIIRFEGVEPPAADEEPVARVTEGDKTGNRTSTHENSLLHA